ncbi:MAG: OmpA family protein [Clostridia bacterium]|nr:MAG: OmpA family protein [Clostridia bacterium]
MKRRYDRPAPDAGEAGESYSISISDLMAALLTIFILALTYYMLSFSQATAQLMDNEDKRREILEKLEGDLLSRGIKVEVDIEHGVLRLPEGILFDKGQADLKPSGIHVMDVLAPALKTILQDPEYQGSIETIFIEGHTDSDPVRSGRFPSNWELSTQRAINTWNKMLEMEPGLESIRNSIGQPIFSVSGYADRRPVPGAVADTENDKQKNRRIDLRFSMTPPRREEAAVIEDLRRGLEGASQ